MWLRGLLLHALRRVRLLVLLRGECASGGLGRGLNSYKIVLIQIVATVTFAIAFVPIHELGHLLLAYPLGLKPMEIVLFNFDAFQYEHLVNTIRNFRSSEPIGWVVWWQEGTSEFPSLVQNLYYHIFLYATELLTIIWLNAKILRRTTKA